MSASGSNVGGVARGRRRSVVLAPSSSDRVALLLPGEHVERRSAEG